MARSARVLPALAAVVFVAATSLTVATPVRAASVFTPTRFDDPPPGTCDVGDCSLREAIIAANASPGSTVSLSAGVYTLTITGADNNASRGDLDINAAMTLTGVDSSLTTVQFGTSKGNGLDRIFDVNSANPVLIEDMTIRFGTDTDLGSGGCIKNIGDLTLASVVVRACTARRGGGIASYKTLSILDSELTNNAAISPATTGDTGGGGGIAGGNPAGGARGSITISRTTIDNNSANNTGGNISYGAGFSNVADMTIADSFILDNMADSSAGGINGRTGSLSVTRTTFDGNLATRDAGGMTTDGTFDLTDSTFSNNQAGYHCTGADCDQAFAGGLLSTPTAVTTVNNSTFSGNSCLLSGGGLLANAVMTVRNTTIVNNTCARGAGLTSNAGQTHIQNVILANNTANPGGDCSGTLTSDGYNLIGTLQGCVLAGSTTGNIIGADPQVEPLADNGGPTQTRALKATSPAINAGPLGGCGDPFANPVVTDQRGYLRPAMSRCDMGAYERQTSVVLWTASNTAMAWQLNGSKFVTSKGFGGPGETWSVSSYTREPDGSYRLLWANDNHAQLWRLSVDNRFLTSKGFTGPGAGWRAESVFFQPNGSYKLLWARDNTAQVWSLSSRNGFNGSFSLVGPGASFTATSYALANDGTQRVLWSSDNTARLWTLSSGGTFRSSKAFGGPGAGWTATSVNLHGDGSYDLLWTRADGRAAVWTISAGGSVTNTLGLGGPSTFSAQSYFFE